MVGGSADTSVWMAWSAGIQPVSNNNLLTESLSVPNGSGVQQSASLRALPFNKIFTIHLFIICLWLKKKYSDKGTHIRSEAS